MLFLPRATELWQLLSYCDRSLACEGASLHLLDAQQLLCQAVFAVRMGDTFQVDIRVGCAGMQEMGQKGEWWEGQAVWAGAASLDAS